MIGKDIILVSEEIFNLEDSEKSDTEIETYDSKEELNFPQDYEIGGINILDDLNEKEMNNPRVQAMFEWTRHSNSCISIISQRYYE